MQSPYTERFLDAFEFLKSRGEIKSQNKFCQAVGIPTSHISAFKKGVRNVTLQNITNLNLVFGVSTTYLHTGRQPIMEPTPEELSQQQRSELEKKLAAAQATLQVQEKIIAAKDAEINYLRELLRLELKDKKQEE